MKSKRYNVTEDRYYEKRKIVGGGVIGLAAVCSLLFTGCGVKDADKGVALEAQITPIKYNRDAIVTVMSDDGIYETGVMLDELGDKHNIKITVSGIVSYVEPHLKEWKKLERKGNLELISHSYTHLKMSEDAGISVSDLEHEITDSIQFYKKHFKTDQVAFTPPENQMCGQGYEILADNDIRAMRQGGRGYNTIEPQRGYEAAQWYNLYTFGIGDVSTTEERNAWIDGAVQNHAWLIEMWHDVTENGDHGLYQEIAYADADAHLSYIADKQSDGDIWAASMVDAVKYLSEKEYATVSAAYNGAKITVSLTCDSAELPSDIYNDALTIRVLVPEEADDFTKVISSDKKNEVRIFKEEGDTYLEFEMVPNGKDVIIKLQK